MEIDYTLYPDIDESEWPRELLTLEDRADYNPPLLLVVGLLRFRTDPGCACRNARLEGGL